MLCKGPHIHPFTGESTGSLWVQRQPGRSDARMAGFRTMATGVTRPCFSLLPLLGGSHRKQTATSYHCTGTCIIILLLAYHHELAITLLLGGREAAGDKAPQLRVYISEPFHLVFQFWIDLFSQCIPIVQKILWSHRKAVFFLHLEGLTHGSTGAGTKALKKYRQKGPSSTQRTPGLHKP